MSSKSIILDRIRKNKPECSLLPEVPMFENENLDLVSMFKENLEFVGGEFVGLYEKTTANQYIKNTFPDIKNIWSNVNGVDSQNIDLIHSSRDLEDIEFGVLKGEFGVAENAAVWIPANTLEYRILPFITQHLLIVLSKSQLIYNMHQAYKKIESDFSAGSGVFISGPSKTADIEQSLVIGAHGSRSLSVILTD